MCGLAIAATMRSVIGCSAMRNFECTLATTTSSSASSSSSWSSRAVGQDVDLDPGEDAERRQLLVEPGDELELGLAVAAASSPCATVSDGE